MKFVNEEDYFHLKTFIFDWNSSSCIVPGMS